MTALDRFEAFAAMVKDDGLAPSEIANRFGITERAVKEVLSQILAIVGLIVFFGHTYSSESRKLLE